MTEQTPAQQGRENWRHGKDCEWRFYKDGRVPVNPHLVGGVFTVDGHRQAPCTCGLAAFLAEHDQQARDLEQAKADVAHWKICSMCGEQMEQPGFCYRGTTEEVQGLREMHEQTLSRAEQLEAKVAVLTEAVKELRSFAYADEHFFKHEDEINDKLTAEGIDITGG